MNIRTLFLLLLFAVVCYFPLFLHLDFMSLRMWDEARRAVNALEMATNGNWLVTYYDGAPEMWGTKPPFLIWCQAICMKIFGFNELALRLPSALAGLSMIAVLVTFCHKVLGKPLIGFFAGLILLTTKGFISIHVTRTGDFDALLTLWQNLYLLLFFVYYLQTDKKKQIKYLYLAALAATLAGLTKGVAGFFFIPGIFLFALSEKRVLPILKNKHFWAGVTIVLGTVLGFYFLRNYFNPGYIQTVLNEEVGGRYFETIGGHDYPWYHYLESWIFQKNTRFAPWAFFIPLGLILGWWSGGRIRKLTKLLVINSFIFMCVVSLAQTKINWYQAPVFPGLALLIAIGLERIYAGIKSSLSLENKGKETLLLLTFVVALWGMPYINVLATVYFPEHPKWEGRELKYGDFMKKNEDLKNYTIIHPKYNSHAVFYKKAFNERGANIRSQALKDFYNVKHEVGKDNLQFAVGDTIMLCEGKAKKAFEKVYAGQTIREWDSCDVRVVKGVK